MRVTLRRALAAALVGIAALVLPAVAMADANPLVFSYQPPGESLMQYAHPGGMAVLDTEADHTSPDLIRRFRAAGGEVLLYLNPMEVPGSGSPAWTTRARFFGSPDGSANGIPSQYLWSTAVPGQPPRYNWRDAPMLDVRRGSAWSDRVVAFVRDWAQHWDADGIFLDVLGTRLWSPVWEQMSPIERSQWTDGVSDLVTRIRQAVGPSVILVANNAWDGGQPALNGICVEHHSAAEAASWSARIRTGSWFAPQRNLVIAQGAADAQAWRGVPGVTHVSPQAVYDSFGGPLWGFSPLPRPVGAVPPPPSTAAVSVSVAPSAVTVPAGASLQFTARSGDGAGVAWSVNGVPGGNAAVGMVTPAGLYTAPAIAPAAVTVRVATPGGASGQAEVTVTPRPAPAAPAPGAGRRTLFSDGFERGGLSGWRLRVSPAGAGAVVQRARARGGRWAARLADRSRTARAAYLSRRVAPAGALTVRAGLRLEGLRLAPGHARALLRVAGGRGRAAVEIGIVRRRGGRTVWAAWNVGRDGRRGRVVASAARVPTGRWIGVRARTDWRGGARTTLTVGRRTILRLGAGPLRGARPDRVDLGLVDAQRAADLATLYVDDVLIGDDGGATAAA
jgi:hypothetical protein